MSDTALMARRVALPWVAIVQSQHRGDRALHEKLLPQCECHLGTAESDLMYIGTGCTSHDATGCASHCA